MEIPPSVFGEPMWASIHLVALGYPDKPSANHRKHARDFIESFKFVTPCSNCQNHFRAMLERSPLTEKDLDSSHAFFAWTVNRHNEVNERIGKKTVSVEEAREFWMSSFRGCKACSMHGDSASGYTEQRMTAEEVADDLVVSSSSSPSSTSFAVTVSVMSLFILALIIASAILLYKNVKLGKQVSK